MLNKQFRLKKKNEVARVLRKKTSQAQGNLILKFDRNNSNISRFAFLASKRVFPRAVQRNRFKRQARELIRKILDEIKPGYDIVLIIRAGTSAGFSERKESLASLFKKANLLKSDHA